MLSPPAPDAPIGEFRELVRDHGDIVRWHGLLAFASFFGLFLPGVIGLRHRLGRAQQGQANPHIHLMMLGAITVTMSVTLTLLTTGVLGLAPEPELSDSVLRMLVMTNTWAWLTFGSVATALFLVGASLAMRDVDPTPIWLVRFGLTAGVLSGIGMLWMITGDVDGPLTGLVMITRAMFLIWTAATGLWLTTTSAAAIQPAATAAPVPA